jgi:hypothetical protein
LKYHQRYRLLNLPRPLNFIQEPEEVLP